ncbi:MAG: hypothetical protein M1820_008692 [Bogoriella megaspora]|nr:MAG: hypothetical protein M1820_008692 [Bogoriella megaspora]
MAPSSCPFASGHNIPSSSYDTFIKSLDSLLMVLRQADESQVKVIVGSQPNRKTYCIYRCLLCHDSSYFRKALSGESKEAHERTITLDQDSVETFKAVHLWLHTRRIYQSESGDPNAVPLQFEGLFKIYFFADMKGMPALKNAAVDAVFTKYLQNLEYPARSVPLVYENTSQDCTLRRVLVDLAVRNYGCQRLIQEHRTNLVNDFLVECIMAMRALRGRLDVQPKGWIESVNRCQYHDHSDP